MPEQYDYVKIPSQGEKNPRKKILKLGRKITDVCTSQQKVDTFIDLGGNRFL